jgi:hypothetical protein
MSGRRRRGLADLIGEVGAATQDRVDEGPDREDATAEATERTSEGMHESRTGGGGEATFVPSSARDPGRGEAATPARALPKYLALQRKEARLRGDQVDALASLARRMNRGKANKGSERITENTLIRVAVDWLLSREEAVGASSEEEIRRSLGVPGPSVRSGPI